MSKMDDKGVSPILAVILMIAITLMIAGILSLWVFSFLNEEHKTEDMYLFEADLNSTVDTVSITVMNGNIIKTTDLRIIVNETDVPVGAGPLNTGEPYVLNCGFDVVKGQNYHIKIIKNNKMIFDQDRIAL